MARQFKLLSQHYIDDRILEAGEVIGEGTVVPFTDRPPSTEMEGLDEASQAEVEAVKAKSWGIDPTQGLATTIDGENTEKPADADAPAKK